MATKKQAGYDFDKYVEEAEVEDFVITLKDGDDIHITNPGYDRLERYAQGVRSGDLELVFGSLCGDAFLAVKAALAKKKAGQKAIPAIMEDILDHFEMYDEIELVGPGGGVVTEKRPTKIRALIGLGYRPKGE